MHSTLLAAPLVLVSLALWFALPAVAVDGPALPFAVRAPLVASDSAQPLPLAVDGCTVVGEQAPDSTSVAGRNGYTVDRSPDEPGRVAYSLRHHLQLPPDATAEGHFVGVARNAAGATGHAFASPLLLGATGTPGWVVVAAHISTEGFEAEAGPKDFLLCLNVVAPGERTRSSRVPILAPITTVSNTGGLLRLRVGPALQDYTQGALFVLPVRPAGAQPEVLAASLERRIAGTIVGVDVPLGDSTLTQDPYSVFLVAEPTPPGDLAECEEAVTALFRRIGNDILTVEFRCPQRGAYGVAHVTIPGLGMANIPLPWVVGAYAQQYFALKAPVPEGVTPDQVTVVVDSFQPVGTPGGPEAGGQAGDVAAQATPVPPGLKDLYIQYSAIYGPDGRICVELLIWNQGFNDLQIPGLHIGVFPKDSGGLTGYGEVAVPEKIRARSFWRKVVKLEELFEDETSYVAPPPRQPGESDEDYEDFLDDWYEEHPEPDPWISPPDLTFKAFVKPPPPP